MTHRIIEFIKALASVASALLFFVAPVRAAQSGSSISQYGITWTFDRAYTYGTYANGDYWVVGPVTLVSITPAYSGGLNGWEVNPLSDLKQGFDARPDLQTPYPPPVQFDPTLVPTLPYTAQPGQSIVKVISNGTAFCSVDCLKTAAVLTVVGSIPANDGQTLFRPPYMGTDKRSFSTTQLRTDLLPSLAPPGAAITLAEVVTKNNRVQFDHEQGDVGWKFRPIDNLPGYGAAVAVNINDGIARLMLNDSLTSKMPALVAMVQGGIDRYFAVLNGQTWPEGGGYNPGRKLSIAFAAVMLDDTGMKNFVTTTRIFAEDQGVQPTQDGHAVFGFNWFTTDVERSYWDFVVNPPSTQIEVKDPYGYIDGGSAVGRDINAYQQCCLSQPWKGAVLAQHLMPSLRQVWNNPLLIDYVDRYVASGPRAQPDPCAPPDPIDIGKPSNQWTRYGVTWGSNGSGGCIQDFNAANGIGRFPTYHNKYPDDQYYVSALVNDLWRTYVGNTPTPTQPHIYIAQSQAGAGDGSSCANARAYSFFNNAANWGSGGGQIGPGKTVHLCGTFNAPAGTSGLLQFQGSGSAGNPITLEAEANTLLQADYWGLGGAISANNVQHIVIDGKNQGTIQATRNGTNLTFQAPSCGGNFCTTGLSLSNCNSCTVRNWTVQNIYVNVPPNDLNAAGRASVGILYLGGSNITISGNTIRDARQGIVYGFAAAQTSQNVSIFGNTISRTSDMIYVGSNNSGNAGALTELVNLSVYGNSLRDALNWDDVNNNNHHDGMQITPAHPYSRIRSAYLYNNTFTGDWGAHCNALVFLAPSAADPTETMSNTYVFNNLFANTSATNSCWNGMVNDWGTQSSLIANNTFTGVSKSYVNGYHEAIVLQDIASGTPTVIRNNIFQTFAYGVSIRAGAFPTGNQNVYYNVDHVGYHENVANCCATLSQWQSTNGSRDLQSVITSPNLNGSSIPQAPSSAIGLGANLTSLGMSSLNADKASVARPGSGAWDAGAYQSSGGASPPNRCDLDSSGGATNVQDVQQCVNQAIGVSTCTNGDVNSSSTCDVLDVQRVVNGALGGPCP